MSSGPFPKLADTIERLGVDIAWTQWSALSPVISPRTERARAVIDPEALILLSLMSEHHERRLLDVTAGWMLEGVRFVSLQRARSLSARLPKAYEHVFGNLAALATAAGDHRWKRYVATKETAPRREARSKPTGPLRINSTPALMLRLRAGFGAGTKADVLTMLLGSEQPVTLRAISNDLNYGMRPLRTALEDMVIAGFVERIDSSPSTFRASAGQWNVVLNGGHHEVPATVEFQPRWIPWADLTVLVAHLLVWRSQAITANWSSYIAASRARDVVERHATPGIVQRFSLHPPASGEVWEMSSFERYVEALSTQARANL